MRDGAVVKTGSSVEVDEVEVDDDERNRGDDDPKPEPEREDVAGVKVRASFTGSAFGGGVMAAVATEASIIVGVAGVGDGERDDDEVEIADMRGEYKDSLVEWQKRQLMTLCWQ
jgi:hypothetical protein